jgi:ribosomal protein L11 methylase PrmA
MSAVPRLGATRDPGSFRDPSGQIYTLESRVLRSVHGAAVGHVRQLRDSKLLDQLIEREWVPGTTLLDASAHRDIYDALGRPELVLEHDRLSFISYPYEWPFHLLRKAALLHLDVHLLALEYGFTLKDASAFNVQFAGVRPRFIDLLSFTPYVNDSLWIGHRQFLDQFLHPLLLTHLKGLAHHAWYRGSPEGIGSSDLVKLLTMRQKLVPRVFLNVVLADRLQRQSERSEAVSTQRARAARLPKATLVALLGGLRRWIETFEFPADRSTWSDYVNDCSYVQEGTKFKRGNICEFTQAMKPRTVLDLGCNTGDFSIAALGAGAREAIGLDGDLNALERACSQADMGSHNFLPLYADLADPAAGQGWANRERPALTERLRCDAVFALAVLHHLAIGRNVPLAEAVRWICSLAPSGIIEWVPKSDPQIRRMLSLREDIFEHFTVERFEQYLREQASIVKVQDVPGSDRRLYWFTRERRAPMA